ncbi:PLAC8 family-domain-containing protein [Schizophyllum commune]
MLTTLGIGGNRNVKNLPIGPDGQRAWSHGMCSACFGDCGTFCTAWWCPCIVFGRNKERYQYLSEQGIPDPEAGKGYNRDSCEKHGFHTIVTGFGWVYQVALRRKLRERYGIRGSDTSDYCLSFWCNPCALTQESREMELEENDLRSKDV